jgi:hypothetical protein
LAKTTKTKKIAISQKQLDAMVEEATVDCYNNVDDERMGFFSCIEENLELPFESEVLGLKVTVKAVEMNSAGEFLAICSAGKHKQKLPLLELPLPEPPPKGHEWILAYRHWSGD